MFPDESRFNISHADCCVRALSQERESDFLKRKRFGNGSVVVWERHSGWFKDAPCCTA